MYYDLLQLQYYQLLQQVQSQAGGSAELKAQVQQVFSNISAVENALRLNGVHIEDAGLANSTHPTPAP